MALDIYEYGHWQGNVFVFNEPIEVVADGGHRITLRRLDTTGMTMELGIGKDDVIHAVLDAGSR